jgi:hypothetical protein
MDIEFLKRVKKYIEVKVVDIDGDWGGCRDLDEIIADKEMPELYDEVLKLLEGES